MANRKGVKPLRLSLGEAMDSDEREYQATPGSKLRLGMHANEVQTITVDLKHLRSIVRSSLAKNLFQNAVFFANKLVTLSGAQPKDVYLLAQAYYRGKQHRRAVHLIQELGFLSSQEGAKTIARLDGARSTRSAAPLSRKSGRFNFEGNDDPAMRNGESDENIEFVLLAAQCLMESNQHEEAQNLLETVLGESTVESLRTRAKMAPKSLTEPEGASETLDNLHHNDGSVNPIAALCLLRGKVYEMLDNRSRATEWFEKALFCDVYCYEAFDALVDNQLRPVEERQLLAEMQKYGLFEGPNKWLKAVYASRLSKYDFSQRIDDRFNVLNSIVADTTKENQQIGTSTALKTSPPAAIPVFIDPRVHNLGNDLDCAADKAEGMYQQHDAQGAYQVTRKIRQKDPYHLRCITVHLASLVELRKKSELFHTAHNLVEFYPSHAVAWFAVGCYYYCISKYDQARRFFHKATNMDASLAVAWLGFGHSFAALDESDQAMAAYRTASRLFIGSHLPVLCTAIEYLRTNNVTLAEQFCRQAKSMCSTDPLVLNELGVVFYRQHRFDDAIRCFQEALKLCKNQPERLQYAWEPAIFNLAHCHRKMRAFDEAIRYYELALSYCPKEASTYSALGLTYHLQGRVEEAIQNYHNALALKPEDTFSSEMLDKALAESCGRKLDDEALSSLESSPTPGQGFSLSFGFKVTTTAPSN